MLTSNTIWKVLCYLNCAIAGNFSLPRSKINTVNFVLLGIEIIRGKGIVFTLLRIFKCH